MRNPDLEHAHRNASDPKLMQRHAGEEATAYCQALTNPP